MIKKLKNKLESFRYLIPVIWRTIRFRVKVWWHNVQPSVLNIGKIKKIVFYALGGIVFFWLFYFFFFSAPANFPTDTIFRVEPGSSLRGVSLKLKQEHFIRSRTVFEAFVIINGLEKRVISTNYYFENKLPVYEIARRISKGEHNLAPVSITIPEGFDINQIADIVAWKLVNFNRAQFLLKAKGLEGYLFPDTYFFLTTANETDAIKSMSENFTKKIAPLLPDIVSSGKKEKDIIVMASIIEGEAKGDNDRGIISGILWKRLSIDMPLQVDAAPETYQTKGLPEKPIGNPGLKAVIASIHPQKSPYLYYLHDQNGEIHYAKNFAEHQVNIKKYLK